MLTLQELKAKPEITQTAREFFDQIFTPEVSRELPDSLTMAIKDAYQQDSDAKQVLFRFPKSVTEQLLDVPKPEQNGVNELVLRCIENQIPTIRGLYVTVKPTLSPARYRLELEETTPIPGKEFQSLPLMEKLNQIALIDMFNIGDTANLRKADAIKNLRSDVVYVQDLLELIELLKDMSAYFVDHHQQDSATELQYKALDMWSTVLNLKLLYPGFYPHNRPFEF